MFHHKLVITTTLLRCRKTSKRVPLKAIILRVYESTDSAKVQELELKLKEAYLTIRELKQKLQQSVTLEKLSEMLKGTLPLEKIQKLQEIRAKMLHDLSKLSFSDLQNITIF